MSRARIPCSHTDSPLPFLQFFVDPQKGRQLEHFSTGCARSWPRMMSGGSRVFHPSSDHSCCDGIEILEIRAVGYLRVRGHMTALARGRRIHRSRFPLRVGTVDGDPSGRPPLRGDGTRDRALLQFVASRAQGRLVEMVSFYRPHIGVHIISVGSKCEGLPFAQLGAERFVRRTEDIQRTTHTGTLRLQIHRFHVMAYITMNPGLIGRPFRFHQVPSTKGSVDTGGCDNWRTLHSFQKTELSVQSRTVPLLPIPRERVLSSIRPPQFRRRPDRFRELLSRGTRRKEPGSSPLEHARTP